MNNSPVCSIANDAPTVSWLICAHRTNKDLKIALQSCLNQTFSDFEIIFVANGPMAEEVSASVSLWFGSDARLHIFSTLICNLNFSLSYGIHNAKGKYIARMDSDDIAYPYRLEKQVNFLDANPEVCVVGTAYELIDSEGRAGSPVFLPLNDDDIRNELPFRNPICHPSVMMRKDVLLAAGGYIGGLYAEDYDLWIRLSSNPHLQFANLPDVCIGYRFIGGDARGARSAYASQGAAQCGHFLNGHGFKWLTASFISLGKIVRLQITRLLRQND